MCAKFLAAIPNGRQIFRSLRFFFWAALDQTKYNCPVWIECRSFYSRFLMTALSNNNHSNYDRFSWEPIFIYAMRFSNHFIFWYYFMNVIVWIFFLFHLLNESLGYFLKVFYAKKKNCVRFYFVAANQKCLFGKFFKAKKCAQKLHR